MMMPMTAIAGAPDGVSPLLRHKSGWATSTSMTMMIKIVTIVTMTKHKSGCTNNSMTMMAITMMT